MHEEEQTLQIHAFARRVNNQMPLLFHGRYERYVLTCRVQAHAQVSFFEVKMYILDVKDLQHDRTIYHLYSIKSIVRSSGWVPRFKALVLNTSILQSFQSLSSLIVIPPLASSKTY